MDLWSTILVAALVGLFCIVLIRKYVRHRARALAFNAAFPSPANPVWAAMQTAFKTAIPYKPVPQTDASLDEGGLYLTSLELLEFLLALEEELDLRIATENLPDSALLTLSALHSYVSALQPTSAPNHA